MDTSRLDAAITALEAATDILIVALSRRPDPDMETATSALKARAAAIHLLAGSDRRRRPPDMNARLRRILESDRLVADHLKADMDTLRGRLESTRQMVHDYDRSVRVPEEVR
jgi:hypothetical protein